MDCGDGGGIVCVMSLLKENDFVMKLMLKYVPFGKELIVKHADSLVALLGVSFGFYRWWVYREQILHRRFEKYLLQSDAKLFGGQDYALASILRPGPGRPMEAPLFGEPSLCAVLREKRWADPFMRFSVLRNADLQLSDAAVQIQKRLTIAEAGLSSLRHQLAAAHLLRGAIAATGVDYEKRSAANHDALDLFKAAQQVPGEDRSSTLKELEGHQLRKMGESQAALSAYRLAEDYAGQLPTYEKHRLAVARAKRYQAETIQALSSTVSMGVRTFSGSKSAYRLLVGDSPSSALAIRSRFGPFRDWDLIEQGDIHYLTAFVSKNLRFTDVCARQLTDAETCYRGVLENTDSSPETNQIRDHATKARGRVNAAQATGRFEFDWLTLPPSNLQRGRQHKRRRSRAERSNGFVARWLGWFR